jgi:5-methyltetrahydropteroyltriglutamate--homocysteine methyltransferase
MMIEAQGRRDALWAATTELIRTEMQACIALGAADIQLDLPHVAMGLADQEEGWETKRAVALVQSIFARFDGIRRSIHLCYGDFGARTWTERRDFHPLLPMLQALDGVVHRVVLEFSLPEQWAERALLAEIPESIQVAAGIIDVKSPIVETPAEIERKIEQLLDFVPPHRLLICPSCGFGRRNVEVAIGKMQTMVAAVRAVNQRLDVY